MVRRSGLAVILVAMMVAGMAQAGPKKPVQSQPPQAPGTTDATGWTAPPATPTIDNHPVVQPTPIVVPPAVPRNTAFPTWSEFPVPTEVPSVTEIAQQVKAETDARKTLTAQVNALTWDKEQAEPFAAAARARMDPQYAAPVDLTEEQKTLRVLLGRHFTPPPPVN